MRVRCLLADGCNLGEEKFEYLMKDNLFYNQLYPSYNSFNVQLVKYPTSFKQIEKEVNAKSYEERKKELRNWNSGKVESLKKTIQELEKKKHDVRNHKIKDILKLNNEISLSDIKDKEKNLDLIKVLLRNGFIAEDYLDYISIFYEGSITRSDNQFLLCVNNQTKLANDYKLNKIDKLVQKLNLQDFETEFVLNHDLLDHLLSDSKYKLHKDAVLKKLSDQTSVSIQFIDEYFDYTKNIKDFSEFLCSSWPNIWKFVNTESNFTKEKKEKYLKYILEYGSTKDVNTISENSNLIETILNDRRFLSIIYNTEKLKSLIKTLNVKFSNIDFENSPKELLEFVYQNNYYELNTEIVKDMIRFKGDFNQVLYDNANYGSIKKSRCDLLIKYVESNLDEYLENVYLNIETNVNEEEDYLKLLINNETIDSENIERIIRQVNTKITKLDTNENMDTRKILLAENKVVSTWHNLFIDYTDSENEITDSIISFVNNTDNATELSKTKLLTKVDGKDVYNDFWKKVLLTEKFADDIYDLITKSNPWWYAKLEIENLSEAKVKSLIKNNVLQPVVGNFSAIKEAFEQLQILFLEKHREHYLKTLTEYPIDSTDLELLLKSSVFSSSEKNNIVDSLPEATILENSQNLKLIISIVLEENEFKVSDTIVKEALLNQTITKIIRIKFFNIKQAQVTNELTTEFLNAIGEPYSDITINGKRPNIGEGINNLKLAETLKSKKIISSFDSEKNGIRISTFKK